MKNKKIKWNESNEQLLDKEIMFITEDKRFRITKIFDADYDLEEGCKLMFSNSDRPDLSEKTLEKQERIFREKFEIFGAVIIALEEKQDDEKYIVVECCGGFFGWEKFGKNHYYVKELKNLVKKAIVGEKEDEDIERKLEKEQIFIANEFSNFMKRCGDKGIDDAYTTYLVFCILGGVTYKSSPDDFYRFIEEIISNNIA